MEGPKRLRKILAPSKAFPILSLLILLTSCTEIQPEPIGPEKKLQSLELYLARTALRLTEFEHYKIEGTSLFHECGEIRRGRYLPKEDGIGALSTAQLAELSQGANAVSQYLELHPTTKLPEPGNLDNLFDPGQAKLTIGLDNKTSSVNTTVSAMASSSNSFETMLNGLAKKVRALGGNKPCGNPDFYGIQN